MLQPGTRRVVSRGLIGLFLAWSVYLAVLTCCFYWGLFGVERNHLDSAWLIETAIAVACAVRAPVEIGSVSTPAGSRFGAIAIGGVVTAAVLYSPSFFIGLLSDDFTLLHRAVVGSIAPVHDPMFRPVPVVAWAALWHALPPGAVPPAMHGFNILLHGLNTALVAVLIRRLGASPLVTAVTAALFVTFPASVEAVAWASGIQDVLATACLLGSLALVTARQTSAGDVAAIVLLVIALLTKETAVSGVVFVALWSLLIEDRRERTRRLWLSVVAAAMTILYVAWRLFVAGSRFDNQPSTTRRGIAHFLTSPFAALGSPWSSADLASWPVVGAVPCLLLIAAIVVFVLQPRPRRQVVTAVVLLLCGLVAVAPVGRYFFVAPDLQGSRYLYLPSAFLSLAIGYFLAHTTVRHERARAAVAAAVVVLFAAGVRDHLRPWQRAAQSRDALFESIAQTVEHGACSTIAVPDPPDNVEGAYVFRNGLSEAMDLYVPSVRLVTPNGGEAAAACTVRVSGR